MPQHGNQQTRFGRKIWTNPGIELCSYPRLWRHFGIFWTLESTNIITPSKLLSINLANKFHYGSSKGTQNTMSDRPRRSPMTCLRCMLGLPGRMPLEPGNLCLWVEREDSMFRSTCILCVKRSPRRRRQPYQNNGLVNLTAWHCAASNHQIKYIMQPTGRPKHAGRHLRAA